MEIYTMFELLKRGNLQEAMKYSENIVKFALEVMDKKLKLNNEEVKQLKALLEICNILYNDTDMEILPIDDGFYDMLIEIYRNYDTIPIGAIGVDFINSLGTREIIDRAQAISFYDESERKDFLFENDIFKNGIISNRDFKSNPLRFTDDTISKRKHDTSHEHPELVGTLDKCKFVLTNEAADKGVLDDPSVTILERDFFGRHLMDGAISPDEIFGVVLELKYDGMSVEADVSNIVESARSRGDTGIGVASDLTPILEGYVFPNSMPSIDTLGVKFEAIMKYSDLYKLNALKGYNYKNCRSAINGLMNSGDAHLYKDLITLVPLQIDPADFPDEFSEDDQRRLLEIDFLNKFYSSKGEQLRYAYVEGNYQEILFYCKKFLEEADYARNFLPFMYDGIVVSYCSTKMRHILGRKDYVNKYSIAVKFNPLKKMTTFLGYTFTVGQDGSITPMIHYSPVEFYGTVHPKSTGSSYARFCDLDLHIGDIIEVEYRNDVMPYVTKANIDQNIINAQNVAAEKFLEECPECRTKLVLSKSGKTMLCSNTDCPGRRLARTVNMLANLNIDDFAEERIKAIGCYHFVDLLNLTLDKVAFLGEVNSTKFIGRMNELKSQPIYDYRLVGSIGFTDIADKKWKLIFNKYTLREILDVYLSGDLNLLKGMIVSIKGIGPLTFETIVREMEYFLQDMTYISLMPNMLNFKGIKEGKQIRFTGIRNKQLSEQLNEMGHDANDKAGVTKTTDILLVPYENYSSGTKITKIGPDTIIVPIDEFIQNMNKYL